MIYYRKEIILFIYIIVAGIMIINNDPPALKVYSNFTVILPLGIGINVAWMNGIMSLVLALPPTFKVSGGYICIL